MTVKELKELLNKMDGNLPVVFKVDSFDVRKVKNVEDSSVFDNVMLS